MIRGSIFGFMTMVAVNAAAQRTLTSVGIKNTIGIPIGSSFQEVPVCNCSAAPFRSCYKRSYLTKGALIIIVIVLLEISSLAVGNCDGAGNCYVSNIATGTGTGADWANACTDFTGACDVTSASMRGTTIWVGGSPGNYLGPSYIANTFSAPDRDRKSTRLNSSHSGESRMPSSA